MREKRRFPTAAASRPALRRATVLVTVVLLALALALALRWALDTTAAAPTAAGNLTCSVKASCDAEEVAVFRMSFTTNAHAGTPAGSAYGYSVCCGGVTGLGSDCSGNYDTVLALSGSDNAHAATTVGGAYTTEVCLSVADGTADCTHGPDCGDYTCLATVSGDTNAHVADCDGSDDYATKVCCYAGPAPAAVGGIAELPDVSDSSGRNYIALALGLAAAALVAFGTGGWYVRRRRWLS
jgi:hypothetical protein